VAQIPQKPGTSRVGGAQPSELESGKERIANDRLEDVCGELEEELEEIKVKYEMYFLGVERMEPARRREDLKRNIARLKSAFTRNAGLRFRIQALHARYLAYERLWLRSAREKEDGTYRRDVLKARRRRAQEKSAKPGAPGRSGIESEDVDLSDFGSADAADATPGERPSLPSASEGEAAAPPVAGSPLPAPAEPGVAAKTPELPKPSTGVQAPRPTQLGLAEAQMRALYEAYLEAKRRCNEDVSKLSYDSVAKSVNKQIPDIVTRYKARAVEFKVVIKDGKAILKAVPRP